MRSRDASAVPLHLRGTAAAHPSEPPPPQDRGARRRHCWVTQPGGIRPGLVLDWRRVEWGWQGLVTYIDNDQTITAWIAAEALRPV